MLILYKNDRNVRFVLFTKTSIILNEDGYVCVINRGITFYSISVCFPKKARQNPGLFRAEELQHQGADMLMFGVHFVLLCLNNHEVM